MMKKAFTISEMMVCLAIMAALAALFLSAIRVKPNSNMVMFRKAYNVTSTTIYEMMQSAVYYEGGSLSNLEESSEIINGEKPKGVSKFCKVFANFVNTVDTPNCSVGDGPSFTTLDGIAWYFPPKTSSGNFSGEEHIRVDVNGPDNNTNCHEGDSNCKEPDVFDIYVASSGKLYIKDEIAKQYLKNSRKISK